MPLSHKSLLQRGVAVRFVSTEDSAFDGRQHAAQRPKVVFAAGRQSGLLRKGKPSPFGNHVELHAVEEGVLRGAVADRGELVRGHFRLRGALPFGRHNWHRVGDAHGLLSSLFVLDR